MSPPPPNGRRVRTWQSEGTNALGVGWVALPMYRFLCILARSGFVPIELFAVLLSAVVAWAVLERKRWGRLAMLGIAAFTLADYIDALYRLTYTPLSMALPPPNRRPFMVELLYSEGGGSVFGILPPLFCLITLFWLSWEPIQMEFERRKCAATRRLQHGIAILLVAVCGIGMLRDGASNAIAQMFEAPRHLQGMPSNNRLSMPIAAINAAEAAGHR
jgi:hypothetical protein